MAKHVARRTAVSERNPLQRIFSTVTRANVNSKARVVRLYERLSAAFKEKADGCEVTDTGFAATEALLFYLAEGELSWKVLRFMALKRYDYVSAYEKFATDLSDHVESTDYEYTDRDDYGCFLYDYGSSGPFVDYIGVQCHLLGNPSLKDSLIPRAELKNRSMAYWRKYHNADPIFVATKCDVAKSYADELMNNEVFLAEIEELDKKIGLSIWEYAERGGFWSDVKGKELKRLQTRNGIGKRSAIVEPFCSRWCLAEIRKTNRNKPFEIRAQTVEVAPESDGSGLRVFIPRYYRFSHIKNYPKTDFAPLKTGMDEVFSTYQRPRKRKMTLVYMMQEAKSFRARMRAQGLNRRESWLKMYEMVNKEFGWSEETTIKRMGDEPMERVIIKKIQPLKEDREFLADSVDAAPVRL